MDDNDKGIKSGEGAMGSKMGENAGGNVENGPVGRGEAQEGWSKPEVGSDGSVSQKAYGEAGNGLRMENEKSPLGIQNDAGTHTQKKHENLNGWDKNYTPKKKAKIPLWAVLVGILVLVGAVAAVVAVINSQQGEGETDKRPGTSEEKPGEEDKDNDDKDETEKPTEAEIAAEREKNVRAIVGKMKAALEGYLVTEDGAELFEFDDDEAATPVYQAADMKVAIPLEKAIGFMGESVEETILGQPLFDVVWQKISAEDYTKLVDQTFTENGFEKTGEDWVPMGEYINWETGVVCTNVGGGMPIYFGCGHISWLDEDDVALANELAEAYEAKEGRTLGSVSISEDIEDSEVKPYQRLTVSIPGAAGLFYRVNPEAKWQFFMGTQAPLACSVYDTEDLRNAFAGEPCYDLELNEDSEVKP